MVTPIIDKGTRWRFTLLPAKSYGRWVWFFYRSREIEITRDVERGA